MTLPPVVQRPAVTRNAPPIATHANNAMTPAKPSHCDRFLVSVTAAAPVPTRAMSADKPYTPVTLANWMTGITLACDAPNGAHGNAGPSEPRTHSVATQKIGASQTPETPKRRTAIPTSHAN